MKKYVVVGCTGLMLLSIGPKRAQADEDLTALIHAMQEQIESLEAEVKDLKGAQAPPGASEEAILSSNRAEELEQRLQGVEEGMLSAFGGVEFGSMIYGSYNYNFNSPSKPQDNNLRVFDPRANTFNMDLLQLTIAKETDSGVGFAAVIDSGKTAGLIQSDWNGDGDLSNGTDNFALQEAYLTYTLNAGNGLDMRFGKFVTLLGAEVIEAPLNPNVSRSFLFGFAIPFTHTGMLASYEFNEMFGLTAGVVNGWDNVVDSNNGKSFLGSLSFTPMEDLAWTFNGVYGAEQPDRGDSNRGVFDTVLTYTPIDYLDFVLNYDYGSETNILSNGDSAGWQGVAGIIQIGGAGIKPDWEPYSFALRGEWFSDDDNTRFGLDDLGEKNVNVWEITGTFKWQMTEGLEARLEYRHDEANRKAFGTSNDRLQKGQDTIMVEFAYLL